MANKLPDNIRTRFAPSPTGFLHLGHVASAIFVWGIAQKYQGCVLLRIEDHDQTRSRPEYVESILADLEWLGFRHEGAVSTQSDHVERYEEAFEKLRSSGRIYRCACSRKHLKQRSGQVSGVLKYDNFCRHREIHDKAAAWRLIVEPGQYEYIDFAAGAQRGLYSDYGDFVLVDKNQCYSYLFAVVCDDIEDGINLVIRGDDILNSTGRQLYLWNQLAPDSKTPLFWHHPLIVDASNKKLSKRNFSEGIYKRRQSGEAKEVLLGEAAYLVGLQSENLPLDPSQIGELFEDG